MRQHASPGRRIRQGRHAADDATSRLAHRLRARRLVVPLVVLSLTGSAALVGVLAGAGPEGSRGADEAALSGATCADTLLVGAPGSGERPGSAGSFGPTLDRVAASYLHAEGTQRTVRRLSVGRSTASPRVLQGRAGSRTPALRALSARTVRRYEGNLTGYAGGVINGLLRAQASCPDQHVVLLGYAQGAQAVHRALLRMQANRPGLLARVVGVALVADGDRVSHTRAVLRGAPAASAVHRGIEATYLRTREDLPVPGSTLPVISVCTAHDVVCDVTRTGVGTATAVDRSYTSTGSRTLAALGVRLWQLTDDHAVPPAGPVTISATQGEALSTPLQVRVDPAQRSGVVWSGVSGLPVGMTLSSSGLLSGTPSDAGTSTVHYWVANTTSPAADHPVPGVLTLTVAAPSGGNGGGTGPTPVGGPASALASGGEYSCQVGDTSNLTCWGANTHGQFGNGSTRSSLKPVAAAAGSTWLSVTTGGDTTCGTKTDATLWCWGLNHRGQVGDGTRTQRLTPVRVAGTGWTQATTAWFDTCATKSDGTLWCWGDNSAGQLGDGTTSRRLVPHQVPGTDWAAVSTGGWHTCAIKTDGSLWCWGRNDFGELGVGDTRNRLTPTRIGSGTDWTQVDASWSNTCAVQSSGAVRCWGRNDRGTVGDGTTTGRVLPTTVAGGHTFTQVTVGDTGACALDDAGRAWCWGGNDYGNLGDGTAQSSLVPVAVGGSQTYTALSAGWLHVCGLTAQGGSVCWGDNEAGQLGDGTTTATARPAVPPAPTSLPAPTSSGPTTFRLGTLNILGALHTTPGRGQDQWTDARIRAEWEADSVLPRGLSIFGVHEAEPDQLTGLLTALDGRFTAWPGTSLGPNGVQSSLLWRSDQWYPVKEETVTIPFIKWKRINPVVLLQNIATGKQIWVMNVHNAPRNLQSERNQDVAIEVAKIHELEKTHTPVFMVGDMNEKGPVFCTVVGQTSLVSPAGGSVVNGSCTLPRPNYIDWMFGSRWVQQDQYQVVRDALLARATDHRLLSARITLP